MEGYRRTPLHDKRLVRIGTGMKPVRLRVQFRLHSSFLANQVSSASPCRKHWLNLIRIVQHMSIFINNKHESDGVL